MEKIKVMLVDDNRELLDLMEEYFEDQSDLEVVGKAYNGNECIDFLNETIPDVLVLDIIMPHMDGLAVLSKIKENSKTKSVQVIMLTAFGQEDVTKKAVDLGASYFILKVSVK
ncbi:response regulator receiver domain-containing protein [Saliterribacillus persicus]|uniref:Response regulator receiver domain-containing protein n=1 Tax=Saliterribacillus persicus TaxID=930114 RepID=A0A368XBS7_9BACI|nr:response regulator receiver domain-containing protein [Saliterribacillus persicus]